jgi:hypothetical protein
MMKKHAIVIALSFVLVGMMFFSVDTPLILKQQESSQNIPSPQEVLLISDEPDSMGNMRMNVMDNPSFENWAGNGPEGYTSKGASGHIEADFAYTGPGVSGNYAGLIEAQGSQTNYAEGIMNQNVPSSPSPLLEPVMALSLDWNTLANPDLFNEARVFVEVRTENSTGNWRNIFYVLSYGSLSVSNGSIDAWFMLNASLNQWNNLDRNITNDFLAVFGAGDLSSSQHVSSIWLRTYSPAYAFGKQQVVFDNVVLTNGSYSGWVGNGDFETGAESPWSTLRSSMAYIEQSTDSTHETYSLNMSIPESTSTSDDGYAYISKNFNYPGGFFAPSSGLTMVEFDWKYNDTASAGSVQYSSLQFSFSNQTGSYYMYLYFGVHNDVLSMTNSSQFNYFKIPGFGVRDTWQHASLDLYTYMRSVGYSNVSFHALGLFAANSAPGASLDLLIDDFQIVTYPLGDPGFEEEWHSSLNTPFAGWPNWIGETGVISRTTDSALGTYALNLTVTGSDSAGVYRDTYIPVHPSDLTNFSWRLDDMGVGTSHVNIEFRLSGSNSLNYILGSGVNHNPSNTSTYINIRADSFNITGSWNQFMVNITADAEEAFGPTSDLAIIQLTIDTFSAPGERVSCIFDEMQFIDGAPPVVDSVDFSPTTPMYYESVNVTVYAHDNRSGMKYLYVNYFNGSNWHVSPVTVMDGYYVATIPALPYGTTVGVQISVGDNSGQNMIDDNDGALYSYTVGDDVDPTLTIDNPVNNTDAEGLLAITATADDLGSGVEYVSFNVDAGGSIEDYTAPYSQNWNLDDASLGSHFIIVTVRDLAGNTVSKTHYITVVDTIQPVLDTPGDVEYTVGETGYVIDWNPTDIRPNSYEVFVDTVSTYTGSWNSSSEHIIINLDGLAVGTYNFTCVVYDDAGNSYSDTVNVTVIEVVTPPTTTTTTTTTTTPTSTTSTTPTSGTTTPPPTGGDITMILLIVAGVGIVGVLLVVFVVLPRMKSK